MKRGDRVRVKQLPNIDPSHQLRNGVAIADSAPDGSTEVGFDDEKRDTRFQRKKNFEHEEDL